MLSAQKKITPSLLLIILLAHAFTGTMAQVKKGYTLVWADEFNHTGRPDSTKWGYEHGLVRNEELQWYQQKNAFCKKGKLIIEARKEQRSNPHYDAGSKDWRKKNELISYSSSCLVTAGKSEWQYGLFEMRGKIDISEGLWPTWWTMGIDKKWPAGGEIDMMEYYRGKLLANVACLGKHNSTEWHIKKFPVDSLGGAAWAAKFHVWKMEWTPSDISLYVDDVLLNHVAVDSLVNKDGSGFNPFKQPHYMLLNLAVGGRNGGDPSKTVFPKRIEIDYVRVYQQQ